MKVLVADKFEQTRTGGAEGRGLRRVVSSPTLKDDALVDGDRCDRTPTCSSSARPRCTEAMLDAGALSLIVRAGAGVNTIDVAAAPRPRHLRLELPGQELRRGRRTDDGLILALDRRIPDNVAELRAGTWNKKEYCQGARPVRAARSACSASATSARKSRSARRAFGMPVVVWSRRFAANAEAAASVCRRIGIAIADLRRRWSQAADMRQRAPRAEPRTRAGFVGRGAARAR